MIKTTLKEMRFIDGVKFANLNKQDDLRDYMEQVEAGEYYRERVGIKEILQLTNKEFTTLSETLLSDYNFVKGLKGGTDSTYKTKYNNLFSPMWIRAEFARWKAGAYKIGALAVNVENGQMFIINNEGYSYCRYVGLIDGGIEWIELVTK